MDRMKNMLEHVEQAEKLYGLNIRGCALAMFEQAMEDETNSAEDEGREVCAPSDVWDECGSAIVGPAFRGAQGHLKERDITIMEAECQALLDAVTAECDTADEVRKVLKTKE